MTVIITTLIGAITNLLVVGLPLAYNRKKASDKQYEGITKGIMCALRNDILQIYLQHKDEKKFTLLEKQSINYAFNMYKEYGGNSFVKDIVDEMNTWKSY